jgi:hypothetical protein
MTELFGGRHPMWTQMMAFFECSVDQALDAIAKKPGGSGEAWEDTRPLESIFAEGRTLQPILVPTRSSWLGYFRYDFASLHHEPQFISARGRFRVTLVGSTGTECRLSIYRSGHLARYLHVMDEGGRWSFQQTGEPQPFEDLAAYQRRRIRDRFTPEMLETYCEALGIRPFDEDFYLPSGIVKVGDDYTPFLTPLLRHRRRKTTARQLR